MQEGAQLNQSQQTETVAPLLPLVPSNTEDKATNEITRIKVHNVHKLVDKEELKQFFETNLGLPIVKSHIIYYGPKSTGDGWVELENPRDALTATKTMNGKLLRDQPISVVMPNKNREQQKIKREKRKKSAKARLPYQDELDQVQKKYPSFVYTKEDHPASFSLSFKPSDPEFPFDLEQISLEIAMPEDYPQTPCSLKVQNEDIPERLRTKMETSWAKRASVAYKAKPMILGLLKWLDNNLEKFLVDEVATEDFQLAKRGIEVIVNIPGKSRPPILKQVTPEVKAEEKEQIVPAESEKTVSEKEEVTDEKPAAQNHKGPAFATATAHKGTQIKAEGLKIQEIGILECTLFRMVVVCMRCRSQVEVSLASHGTYAVECSQCHNAHAITYRKDQMHEASDIIGYLDISGCIPFDVLPSQFTATCLECTTENTWKQLPVTGMDYSQNCTNCHKKLSISLERVRFIKIKVERAPPPDLVVKKKKKVKDPAMAGIKPGNPLPDEGTCKHYKKSKRWMRFPCCGRAFPCDICHQDNNKDGHEMLRANRMLCGLCSREQPFTDKQCNFCGALPTGGKITAFWEGGKGNRDVAKLSKNDPHKFKGMNKTQSQKATRVGPKNT